MKYTSEEFTNALRNVRKIMEPSPVIKSKWLSDLLSADVYLKLECLNPGHSFKIRGAINTLLSQEVTPNFVVTASGGNHGLGVAIASASQGIRCKVFLPITTSKYRVDLLEALGAEVELVGEAWDEANEVALRFADNTSCLYIHPFADPKVILGQGTIVNELVEQVGEFDSIFVSVGGGGLISGIVRNLESQGLLDRTDVYAVETTGADCLNQSINAGKLVTLPAIESIAKTLGARQTTPEIFEYMQKRLSGSFAISDKKAVQAMLDMLNHEKLLVEPATSCIIAALDSVDLHGKCVVIVVCGSNVSFEELLKWTEDFGISF